MKKQPKNSKAVHDINNHLAHVYLTAELLIQEIDGPLNARQKKHIKDVLSEAKKIQELVQNI